MSRTIHVKHTLASQGICTLAPEGSRPGHSGGAIIMRILGVPDDVSNAETVRMVNVTAIYPPRFLLRFDELGGGKVVTGRHLSLVEVANRLGQDASVSTVRQLITAGHIPALRIGKDLSVHEDDLALVEPT